ncbi:dienelactone hydrolase family protein [Brachybacterium sp. ACRRE]|uniref:dienelactone hydrolase family protein n=1 Tax=Brachybacterium sp. ACRRE TaxID=2918184 RepID=UPI001EF1FE0A|nr:dienelactone hydrolase family protein [Brachybacterium sp. ACRRE]MCG7310391.1 acetylxylan esterase [Brachybacterium sp. ACRRE]
MTQTDQAPPPDPREAARARLRALLGCDGPGALAPAAHLVGPASPVPGPGPDAGPEAPAPGEPAAVQVAPEGRDPFPALLKRPAPGRASGAAVVLVPGHGAGMRALVGDGDAYHGAIARRLVDRGVAVLVPEMISFGQRRTPPAPGAAPYGPAESSCAVDAARYLLHGSPVLGARVADASAAVSALRSRADVDAERVGVVGGSGGGAVALLLAALDTRLRAALVANFFSSFAASIAARPHCPCNVVPGLLPAFEMAEIAALVAPRSLVLEAGEADPLFPIAAARASFARLEADREGARDVGRGARLVVTDAGHRLVGEESVDLLMDALG